MLTSLCGVLVTGAHPKGATFGSKGAAAAWAACLVVVLDQTCMTQRAEALADI